MVPTAGYPSFCETRAFPDGVNSTLDDYCVPIASFPPPMVSTTQALVQFFNIGPEFLACFSQSWTYAPVLAPKFTTHALSGGK